MIWVDKACMIYMQVYRIARDMYYWGNYIAINVRVSAFRSGYVFRRPDSDNPAAISARYLFRFEIYWRWSA